MHPFPDSAAGRNFESLRDHQATERDRGTESELDAPCTEPHDSNTAEVAEAVQFTSMVWGFVTLDHARSLGVSEEEISRQLGN